jgi:hypothetical protein
VVVDDFRPTGWDSAQIAAAARSEAAALARRANF